METEEAKKLRREKFMEKLSKFEFFLMIFR
jgi:hypothetical protein